MADEIDLWVDDERPAPNESWAHAASVKETIAALTGNIVRHLDLDYTLSDGDAYDIFEWLFDNLDHAPTGNITGHSSSSSGTRLIGDLAEMLLEKSRNRR